MRRVAAWVLVLAASGCASVKVEQRDGCWVKQTRTFPSTFREEVGPCSRPKPEWSADRLTRLVQECVMHADYRWQSSAMVAWNRGEPLPVREPDEKVLEACMVTTERMLSAEKGALEAQLSDVSKERDSLRANQEQEREQYRAKLDAQREAAQAELLKERERLQDSMDQQRAHSQASLDRARDQMHESNGRLAAVLGEAAKRPTPSAVATATSSSTSEGRADTRSDSQSRGDSRSRGDATPPRVARPTAATPASMCSLPAKRGASRTTTSSEAEASPGPASCQPMTPAEPPEAEPALVPPAQSQTTASVPLPLLPRLQPQ
ncbi:hypothetical protein [Myxococcus faecalis]|uniref:hypothetical protein n=1 Tax=Myxococcus faecalis TaxID=3115646 RepID=UPI003CEB281A